MSKSQDAKKDTKKKPVKSAKEKKEAERRAEIAKAAQEGKPVPPPDAKKPKK